MSNVTACLLVDYKRDSSSNHQDFCDDGMIETAEVQCFAVRHAARDGEARKNEHHDFRPRDALVKVRKRAPNPRLDPAIVIYMLGHLLVYTLP